MNNCSGSLPVDKQVKILRAWLSDADAVVIGAGAGLSSAAGFTYGGRRFKFGRVLPLSLAPTFLGILVTHDNA